MRKHRLQLGGCQVFKDALGQNQNGAQESDDAGFEFQAAVPIAETPKDPPQGDLTVGKSPAGKALKFVHRGSYDAMDATYELITNYLDEKQLEVRDLFVEQYMKDPITTPEDDLVSQTAPKALKKPQGHGR